MTTKLALAVFAAATLAQPALSLADDKPTNHGANSSSLVPHAHTNHRAYGAPIEPAIVGHKKPTHHKPAPKKRVHQAEPSR